MDIVTEISSLSPIAQAVFVLGSFALIFLLAYNRNAGANLIAFLHDLCVLFQYNGPRRGRSSNNKRQKKIPQEKSVLSHALSSGEKMSRVWSTTRMVNKDASTKELLLLMKTQQDGAHESCTILYIRFMPILCYYGESHGLPFADAEDIAQDTLFQVITRIDTFKEQCGDGNSWIYRIHRSKIADW